MADADNFVKKWNERQVKKSDRLIATGSGKDERQSTEYKIQDLGFEELKPEDILRERKHIKTEYTARKVISRSGLFLFWLSLFATIIILFPFIKHKVPYTPSEEANPYDVIEEERKLNEARVIKEAEGLGLDARFSINIEKINARSIVVENVDTGIEKEYLEALKNGGAHAKGTNFPGQGKNIFIFSHSVASPEYISQYNAVFYELYKLAEGDEIDIYFSGVKYTYEVSGTEIVSASDVDFITKDHGGETLILQTCDPPGTTLRRLLIIAGLKK